MTAAHRTLIQAATIPVAVGAAVVPIPPGLVEAWYSTTIFPPLQRGVTGLSNQLPFALLDVLAVTALATVIAVLVRGVRRARAERRIAPFGRALLALCAATAVVYFAFLLLWGLNYRRVPMIERVAARDGGVDAAAVAALGVRAATAVTVLHDEAHRIGWASAPIDNEGLRAAFAQVQRQLADAPTAAPGRLKQTLFGPYFRWTGVDGMINPFGLEVLANPDLLPFERPFIAAHEWAHLAGYADESEASFVAFLTCMQGDAAAQYSGWLFLYWQVAAEAGEEGRARMAAALADGPRRDIQAIIDRVQRGQWPWLRAAGWEVYDQYLKANRVEEGVRSYGAVVTLILRARFEDDWHPVRRAAGDR